MNIDMLPPLLWIGSLIGFFLVFIFNYWEISLKVRATKKNKETTKSKLMITFFQYDGGSKVEPEYTIKDATSLSKELQGSFDTLFPKDKT